MGFQFTGVELDLKAGTLGAGVACSRPRVQDLGLKGLGFRV